MEKNPDVITEYSEDPLYLEFVKDFKKVDSLLSSITPQMIEASSDEEQKALFKAIYTSVGSYFDEEREDPRLFVHLSTAADLTTRSQNRIRI
ncbi:MAG: hypothetical protein J6O50_05050 [Ruminiclostridium sp.]|nr:hypothetical protein [Ruminiclostridium sp.]